MQARSIGSPILEVGSPPQNFFDSFTSWTISEKVLNYEEVFFAGQERDRDHHEIDMIKTYLWYHEKEITTKSMSDTGEQDSSWARVGTSCNALSFHQSHLRVHQSLPWSWPQGTRERWHDIAWDDGEIVWCHTEVHDRSTWASACKRYGFVFLVKRALMHVLSGKSAACRTFSYASVRSRTC